MSERDTDRLSNREVLSNALASAAESGVDKGIIEKYQGKINYLNEQEAYLAEIKKEIKDISFSKGKRDTARLNTLKDEAAKTANRINVADKQLLRIEAASPIKSALEAEKTNIRKATEAKGKEALETYKKNALRKQAEIRKDYQEARAKSIARDKKATIQTEQPKEDNTTANPVEVNTDSQPQEQPPVVKPKRKASRIFLGVLAFFGIVLLFTLLFTYNGSQMGAIPSCVMFVFAIGVYEAISRSEKNKPSRAHKRIDFGKIKRFANKKYITVAIVCLLGSALLAVIVYQQQEITSIQKEFDEYKARSESLRVSHEGEIERLTKKNRELTANNQDYIQKLRFYQWHVAFVYDSRNSTYYHTIECPQYDYSTPFWAYNIEAAKSQGYLPCPYCH